MNPETPHPSSSSEQPALTRRFPADRLAFFQRIAEGQVPERTRNTIALNHLTAFGNLLAKALRALDRDDRSFARTYLELGRADFDAAVALLSNSTPAHGKDPV